MLLLKNPLSYIQKKFRIGSGNIIGKWVIQDFFTCAGALPSMGSSILHRTSSLADAIAMLVVELEIQFMHMHPCVQRIFQEFSNIEHSSVKRAATIFLAHEFIFIMKEAKEIFAHYRVDAGRPPIEAILFDQEEIRRFQSLYYVAFNKNQTITNITGATTKKTKLNFKLIESAIINAPTSKNGTRVTLRNTCETA